MKSKILALFCALSALSTCAASALDLALPKYKPVWSLSGRIKAVGSGTLNRELETWAEAFQQLYPGVEIDIERKGSLTTPPALLSGDAQIGSMSRLMTREELAAFDERFGYQPTAVLIAIDALAIFVRKDNPLACLTIPQLDRLFSSARIAAGGKNIERWGELGLSGDWAQQKIALLGRSSVSNTNEFFKNAVLGGGSFKDGVKEAENGPALLQAIEKDKFAIGYSSIGFMVDGARTVSVSSGATSECRQPSLENTSTGQYPLARSLYFYLLKKPGQPVDPIVGEFIRYLLSADGQTNILEAGFFPVDDDVRRIGLKKLGL